MYQALRRGMELGQSEVCRGWRLLVVSAGLMLIAAVMRLWELGSRAMHHDESLHAYYAWNLFVGNGFQHDPMMHGPLQMEATAGVFFIFGDTDFTARLLYALAGIALVGLPYFFRARLGNLGVLAVSTLLVLSPSLLYFSRFARNDILMAVWSLGLVICMWRYIDEGRNRYLYVAAAFLALAFATKETAYILTFTLGFYLVLALVAQSWPAIRGRLRVGEAMPLIAIMRVIIGVWSAVVPRLSLSGISRPTGFLIVLFTLTLPLGGALISVFVDISLPSWFNLVLVNSEGSSGPIGAPLRGGLVIAFLVVVGLLCISVYVGSRWSWSVWWRCAIVFWFVWVLLYSTFFTHIEGIGSGVWQSLGYWFVQQGEARGSQPWYYYLMITPIYEFLPLFLAVIGGVVYVMRGSTFGRFAVFWAVVTFVPYAMVAEAAPWSLMIVTLPLIVVTGMRRDDPFRQFLVYWTVTTFVLYTLASEKMPWLLVNITLPIIILAGNFLGEILQSIQWRRLVFGAELFLLPGIPLFVILLYRLALVEVGSYAPSDVLVAMVMLGIFIALVALGFSIVRRVGFREFAPFVIIPVVGLLLVLSVRAGWYASYRNGDIPVEMLVYTQTSPDIPRLVKYVQQNGDVVAGRTVVAMTVDGTSGFSWPWAWYLRNYTRVEYPAYDRVPMESVPNSSVVLIHSRNKSVADSVLGEAYTEGMLIKHRWWFPENYRSLTIRKFLASFIDRSAWRNVMGYFLHREIGAPLGSENAYVYFSLDFPSSFVSTH